MPLTSTERSALLAQVDAHEALILSIPVEAPVPAPPAPTPPAPAPTGSWQPLAGENSSFTLDREALVRFGVDTDWAEATLQPGTYGCNPWGVWGDPAPERLKSCQIWTGTAPAPAPVPAPPVPTPPAPPPPSGRAAMYFSAATGVNSNPGTAASPKRDMTGMNVNSLQGMDLFFEAGGSYTFNGTTRLANPNVNATNRLVFNRYGTGPRPVFRSTGTGPMFEWNSWQGTTMYAGYEFRNIRFDGEGRNNWGFWFRGPMDAVVIDKCEITGFMIGINSQNDMTSGPVGVRITNNRIVRNSDMGMLGHYDNTVIENNDISENNFGGSGFSHGTYIGGGHNISVRNNRYLRNSAVNGVGTGGNMTFHGQIDGLLVEGNWIEQDRSTDGAWQMSITQGYTTAEWFRNMVVRGNWFKNAGNTAMNVQSAPGALIEDNVVVNTQGTRQTAIGVGMEDRGQGDETTTGATVRNNRAYVTNGSVAEFVLGPGSGTMTGNTVTQGLPTEQYVGFDLALLD